MGDAAAPAWAAHYLPDAALAGDPAQLARDGRRSSYEALRQLIHSWLTDTAAFTRHCSRLCWAAVASGLLLGSLTVNGIFNLFTAQVGIPTNAAGDVTLTTHMASVLSVSLLFFFLSVLLALLTRLSLSSPSTRLEHNYLQQFLYHYHAARSRNLLAALLVSLACLLQLVGVVIILWDVVCQLPSLVDNGWCSEGVNVPLIVTGGLLCVGCAVWMLAGRVVPGVDGRIFDSATGLGDAFQAHLWAIPTWVYRGRRWPEDAHRARAKALERALGTAPPAPVKRSRRKRVSVEEDLLALLTTVLYSAPASVFDWLVHVPAVLLAAGSPGWFPPDVQWELPLPGVASPLRLTTVARLRREEGRAYESGIALCNRRDCARFLSGHELVWHASGSDFDLHPHCLPLDDARDDGDAVLHLLRLPRQRARATPTPQGEQQVVVRDPSPFHPPHPRLLHLAPRPLRMPVRVPSLAPSRVPARRDVDDGDVDAGGMGGAATTEQVTAEVSLQPSGVESAYSTEDDEVRFGRGVWVWDVPSDEDEKFARPVRIADLPAIIQLTRPTG